ncbi:MAG: glycosyltransferase family 1 protein [Puniceicoccaceae bacterium]|nr:MAG: glycosyltransferase family 1 protein [Puniceicoccaceae bacterium]
MRVYAEGLLFLSLKVAILYNTSDYLLRFRTELIRSLQEAGLEVVAITPRDRSTPRLAALDVRWREWQLAAKSLNPFRDFAALLRLQRILVDERPDAMLNFTIKPVLYGSIVARWVGVPTVASMITGMGSMFLANDLRKRALLPLIHSVYRVALRSNRGVLFQNDEDLNYFLEKRLLRREQTLRTNGSGVNLSHFVWDKGKIVKGSFLLIARMIEAKGVREFARAARLVKGRFPDAKFILAGPLDINSGAITRAEIAGWEREGIIEYAGEQPDVRPFLARAEVYVLPSYYFEGVPRSILEALAMGKPVITTDWRGCRDTVEPGVNGFLVPPRDAEALALAMECFLQDPALSALLGSASRQMAEEKFDVSIVNRTMMDALGIPRVAAPAEACAIRDIAAR